MKTTNLHQDTIIDEYKDIITLANELFGFRCCDTVMQGDDRNDLGTKYQITIDPYAAPSIDERINLAAFESYFYENYGSKKDRCYFDTPYVAFFALTKAWNIWNNHLDNGIKEKYIKPKRELFNENI